MFSTYNNIWNKTKFITTKYGEFQQISYILNIKYYFVCNMYNICQPVYKEEQSVIEFCYLNHIMLIKFLCYLYFQYKMKNDKLFLYYFETILIILDKSISIDLINQLKIFLIQTLVSTSNKLKKENKEIISLKNQYFNKFHPLFLKTKEFSIKLNLIRKLREYLKNGMILEVIEELKTFQKYNDYKNIIYFILLYILESIKTFFFYNEGLTYYFKNNDTTNILSELVLVDNDVEEIKTIKNIFIKKVKKNKFLSFKINNKIIFSKENVIYFIYVVYEILFIGQINFNFPNIFNGITKIEFLVHILFLLINIVSKINGSINQEYNDRLISSVQNEQISNIFIYRKKLNNLVKNIIIELLSLKDLYLFNPGVCIKILRFNFRIDNFRDIYCDKLMTNLNKLISLKLLRLINLLFDKNRVSFNYQILSEFIKIKEFKGLFNLEQTVNIIFKFKEKPLEGLSEETKDITESMLYMRCYFIFISFIISKIGNFKNMIFQDFCNQVQEQVKIKENKKYANLFHLLKEFMYILYFFQSLINCLLIQLVEAKKIININPNLNLGIEYLINLMRLGFFNNLNKKDIDFLELDTIYQSMILFLKRGWFEERLLITFYIYCLLDESLDRRNILVQEIKEIVKKKIPIYYEKIQKICKEKEIIYEKNENKRTIKFINDYDQDFPQFNNWFLEILRNFPQKDYYKNIFKKSKEEFFYELKKSELMMKYIEKYIDFEYLFSNYQEPRKIIKENQIIKEDEISLKNYEKKQKEETKEINHLEFFSILKDKIVKTSSNDDNVYLEKDESAFLILKENRELDIFKNDEESNKSQILNETNQIKNDNLNYSFDNQSKYLSDNSIINENLFEDKSKITDFSFFDFDVNDNNETFFRTNIEKSIAENYKLNDSTVSIKKDLEKVPSNIEIKPIINKDNINVLFSFNKERNDLKMSISFTKKKYISIKFIFLLLDNKIKKRVFKLIKRYRNKNKGKNESLKDRKVNKLNLSKNLIKK